MGSGDIAGLVQFSGRRKIQQRQNGICFRKWLEDGLPRLNSTNKQVGGWPKFATATGTGFKSHELFYKIPEGAATVRITPANMGVSGDVSFRNVRVVPSANDTVADLDALPPEGTAEEHMNLQGAERLKNSYREQICLNGLWRFFPILRRKDHK